MDISNGEGIGVSLFVQGCPFHCYNCFNPNTWDFNAGKEWTQKIEQEFLELTNQPYIKRVSFLGGEPLSLPNIETICDLIKKIKAINPNKTIWIWTGYKFDSENLLLGVQEKNKYFKGVYDFQNYPLNTTVHLIDYIVDGQYIDELRNLKLKFRGSKNQRIYYNFCHTNYTKWEDVTDKFDGERGK